MAAPARRTSWAAPKQTLSLGPAFDKSWGQTVLEYMTCSGGASVEEIQDLIKDAKTPVTLHVYAVGHAKAIQEINYVVENFLHEGGVFHGAIEVFGQEFSFGGCRRNKCGIFACKPTKCPMHTYRESIYLGDCGKDLAEVQAILDHMKSSWMGPTYDLLRKNCCSFSDAFAQALGVGPIPKWVHHLADVGATLDDDVKAVVHGLHFVEDKVKGSGMALYHKVHPPHQVDDHADYKVTSPRR